MTIFTDRAPFPTIKEMEDYKTIVTRLGDRPTVSFGRVLQQINQCDAAQNWMVNDIETKALDGLYYGDYNGSGGASAAARYNQLTHIVPGLRSLGDLRAEELPARAAELRRVRVEQDVLSELSMRVVHMMGHRFALKL